MNKKRTSQDKKNASSNFLKQVKEIFINKGTNYYLSRNIKYTIE
jgi:hypothetical protein